MASRLHPALAVNLIAERGLYVSRIGDHLGVRPEDDRDGLLRGVDLNGQAKRLEGIRAGQERELTQLRARVRKYRLAGLSDEALADSSEWMRTAARRWRDTPVMQRMVVAGRALARTHAQWMHDNIEWLPFDPVRGAPRTLSDLTAEERANLPVELAPEPVAVPQPTPERLEISHQRSAAPPSIFSRQERRTLRQRMADRGRARQRIDVATRRAIEARAGDRQSLTPHGARLLARLRDGFDPTRVDRRIGIAGRSLDQRDASEIALLIRHPVFAERVTFSPSG